MDITLGMLAVLVLFFVTFMVIPPLMMHFRVHPRTVTSVIFWYIVCMLILTIALVVYTHLTIFEDGSFTMHLFDWTWGGCLPWGSCSL